MNEGLKQIADRLWEKHQLTREEYIELIRFRDAQTVEYLAQRATAAREQRRGTGIEVIGQTELSNYCRNDCYYCRLRRENRFVKRYRMDEEEILSYCRKGYRQGIRTFLLQGGEDLEYTEKKMAQILRNIKKTFPGCRIMLALGEKSKQTYKEWHDAGADCYLLRLETSVESHYRKLHPGNMSLLRRKQCLWELKEIGYQVGTGFLIGSPYQTVENVAEDLTFLTQLVPDIVEVSPFIPAMGTPFENQRGGNADLTCFLTSVIRLMMPGAMIPVSTELAAAEKSGRIKGIAAGAEAVVLPLTSAEIQRKYAVYSWKSGRSVGKEETLEQVAKELGSAGYETAAYQTH